MKSKFKFFFYLNNFMDEKRIIEAYIKAVETDIYYHKRFNTLKIGHDGIMKIFSKHFNLSQEETEKLPQIIRENQTEIARYLMLKHSF